MTLTELKYIVAAARDRHFGRAAEACFVSQPTLSVAIRKLEDELGVTLFERGGAEVGVTPIGQRIIAQAQKVLEESASIKEISRQGHDPLAGLLRVGVIHTIGSYLLPHLVPMQIERTPQMPLLLQENFTVRLVELLRQGEIDCAIIALPLPEAGLMTQALYDESFMVAVPQDHAWAERKSIDAQELKQETMLLLVDSAGEFVRIVAIAAWQTELGKIGFNKERVPADSSPRDVTPRVGNNTVTR